MIKNRLAAPAELDLSGVSFVYSGGQNVQAVLHQQRPQPLHLRRRPLHRRHGRHLPDRPRVTARSLVGLQRSTTAAAAASRPSRRPAAPSTTTTSKARSAMSARTLAWDPHSEKGTGVHGAILWDATTSYALHEQPLRLLRPRHPDRRLRRAGQRPTRLTGDRQRPLREVRQRDRGGARDRPAATACSSGETPTSSASTSSTSKSTTPKAGHSTRRGLTPGQQLAGVTVEYGRAMNTNLNPRFAGQSPWDSYGGVVYKRVRPSPLAASVSPASALTRRSFRTTRVACPVAEDQPRVPDAAREASR